MLETSGCTSHRQSCGIRTIDSMTPSPRSCRTPQMACKRVVQDAIIRLVRGSVLVKVVDLAVEAQVLHEHSPNERP